MANLVPASKTQALNVKINDDPGLRDSNDGKHWLSLYGQGEKTSFFIVPDVLLKSWRPSALAERGIQVASIQDKIYYQAISLIDLNKMDFSHWNKYIATFAPPSHQVREYQKLAWQQKCKSIIDRIFRKVEEIRIPEWQRDPNRQPLFLPDTTRLRLWLTSYPHLDQSKLSPAKEINIFVVQLLSFLRGRFDTGLRCIHKLEELTAIAVRCDVSARVDIAQSLVGEQPQELRLDLMLREELAETFL